MDMEDDATLRLELEWSWPRSPVDAQAVSKRYGRLSGRLVESASASTVIDDLAEGWSGFRYVMPDARKLVIAYFAPLGPRHFSFLRLHFGAQTQEDPIRTLRGIASSFRCHVDGDTPWAYYDVSFALDSTFKLAGTSLEAGKKILCFHWRLRRLFVWHISLADVILSKHGLSEWAVDQLNSSKHVRGPTFFVDANGAIAARRRLKYPLGHFEEMGAVLPERELHSRLISGDVVAE